MIRSNFYLSIHKSTDFEEHNKIKWDFIVFNKSANRYVLWMKIIAIASDEPNYVHIELQKETIPFNSNSGNGKRRDDELAETRNDTSNAITTSVQNHPEAITPNKTILNNVENSQINRSLKFQRLCIKLFVRTSL